MNEKQKRMRKQAKNKSKVRYFCDEFNNFAVGFEYLNKARFGKVSGKHWVCMSWKIEEVQIQQFSRKSQQVIK